MCQAHMFPNTELSWNRALPVMPPFARPFLRAQSVRVFPGKLLAALEIHGGPDGLKVSDKRC